MSDTISVSTAAIFIYEKERLTDLLVTALEGGIGYWARAYEYDHDGEYPHAIVVDFQAAIDELGLDDTGYGELDEAYENRRTDLAPWTYYVGLQELAETCAKAQGGEYGKNGTFYVQQWLDENEDAITADVLFQLACFGEVVYG